MTEQEYTPTEARLRERVKGSLGEYAHEFGIDGEAAMDEWVDQALAERDNRVRADERAKRPDREQIDRIQFEIDNVHQIHGDTCLCGFTSSRSRSRTEHLTALFADAVLSALALEPETDQELQDRIEVLEKNLAYEVAQKIKLAEQLQAATATGLTLEQARWKMHAGIESRCSEEVAAEVKPVIDLVFSSLALAPEAREDAELFHDQDGDLWKLTDKGEWFHEEEPGEFRRVLSIDAEDQTLTPVGHAELAPDAEVAREVE